MKNFKLIKSIKTIKTKFFLLIMIGMIFLSTTLHCYAINKSLDNSINQIISNHGHINSNLTPTRISDVNENNRFAFVLFYMQSCPHCQRFDPILKAFSDTHHISVLAYTLDGKSLPSFPDSFNPNQTEILKFFPDKNPVVPALFLMDQKTHRIYPVSQGEANEGQISQRYSQLKNAIESNSINSLGDEEKRVPGDFKASEQDFKYE